MGSEDRKMARVDEVAYLLDVLEPSEEIAIAIRAMHLDAVRKYPVMEIQRIARGERQRPNDDIGATARRLAKGRAAAKRARKARRRK